jgi:prefoldin subunit 5
MNSVPTNHFDELSDRISKVNSEISQIDSDMAYVSQELSYADQAQNMEKTEPNQCFLIWCW